MKLSAKQIEALEHLSEGPMEDFHAAWMLGKARNQTLKALFSRGLARYFPTPESWRITPNGRALLKRLQSESNLSSELDNCSDELPE